MSPKIKKTLIQYKLLQNLAKCAEIYNELGDRSFKFVKGILFGKQMSDDLKDHFVIFGCRDFCWH